LVAGLFSSIFCRSMIHDFYSNNKLFEYNNCCRIIRANTSKTFSMIGGLSFGIFTLLMISNSYYSFKYYNKYKNENIWNYNESVDMLIKRERLEQEFNGI